MNTKFLLSPAYLASVSALIVGAIFAGTHLMIIGWIVFIIGLALNALSLVVLANREYLRKVQGIGVIPKAATPVTVTNHTSEGQAPTLSES